jgi:very-short-patch-repair endonuclease
MTDAEKILWRALRGELPDAKFRRQVPLGPYTADFACHSARLVIEVDGGQHNEADVARRTSFLNGEGYEVLRFWNHDVLQNIDGVVATIAQALPPRGDGLGRGPAASAADKTQ